MRCINKKKILSLVLTVHISLLTACGAGPQPTYDPVSSSRAYGLFDEAEGEMRGAAPLFTADIWLPEENSEVGEVPDRDSCMAAGLIDVTDQKVIYSFNIEEKVYPASTTKIMTCLLALKYGDLDQVVTIPPEAVTGLEHGSSLAGLKAGDQIPMQQLLYGLMLPSGNDAAIAIAIAIGGSIENFVSMMNEEARALGATDTHFVTVNGLHDEDHYTTAYDMSLIFHAAMADPTFAQIAGTSHYDALYQDALGNPVKKTYKHSVRYFSGKKALPEGITLLSAKSGTTGEAKYCLVTGFTTERGKTYISVVYGSDTAYSLYRITDELMETAKKGGAD